MNKIRDMLTQDAFLVIFILLSLLLFNWHSIGFSERVDEFASYKYLFGTWAVIIFILFLISKSHLSLLHESNGRRENGNSSNADDNTINNEEGHPDEGHPAKIGEDIVV
ncbi:MAG: hypothetical protein HQK89_05415 [Nitrospirae bacterium]|nr:hypothetical protein [Nitrospirota bacterium]